MTAFELEITLTDEDYSLWNARRDDVRKWIRRETKNGARNMARKFNADAAIIKAPDGTVLERVKV